MAGRAPWPPEQSRTTVCGQRRHFADAQRRSTGANGALETTEAVRSLLWIRDGNERLRGWVNQCIIDI